jgi:hypothetical protein
MAARGMNYRQGVGADRNVLDVNLAPYLRETFDALCDETLSWSQYHYGTSLISYSILMELVKDGWKKVEPHRAVPM